MNKFVLAVAGVALTVAVSTPANAFWSPWRWLPWGGSPGWSDWGYPGYGWGGYPGYGWGGYPAYGGYPGYGYGYPAYGYPAYGYGYPAYTPVGYGWGGYYPYAVPAASTTTATSSGK
ncbi:hypothetical protein [uncultured Thiodictyon sp.]|uniref:hypothetical protein n=1 Tax=uncultured Thiodictyon sp. TaxID=1846217 RepID=UPI0025CC0D37|nr:hypothetical protein [uncultured Thiodictyon sp.]